MKDEEVLQKVKAYIRRSHSKLDDELLDTIAACKKDLESVGVSAIVDETILSAIKLYCKADTREDPADAAYYMGRYNDLKSSLMMSSVYCRSLHMVGSDEEGSGA